MRIEITTRPQEFPAGTVAGAFLYTLQSDTGYFSQGISDTTMTFPDATAPGNYTASAQRLDSHNVPIGPIATGTLTVEPGGGTPVMIDVPDTIVVTFQ